MDWDDIIERNAERLVMVVTELFAMAGLAGAARRFFPAMSAAPC